MFNKRLLSLGAAAALIVGAASVSAADISANVSLTSDYKFRGISQSDESIALQGGFDAEFDNGFYIGTWGSTVDFDTNGGGYDGSLELDYYAGWGGALGDSSGIGVDVGLLYYDYPGDNGEEGDYLEFYSSLSWEDLAIGMAYSSDYYAETDTFWYLYGDYSVTLPEDFVLSFHLGYNALEDDGGFLSNGEDSYIDYSISISREWASVEWALAIVGTDLDEKDVFDTDWGEDSLIFSISKSM